MAVVATGAADLPAARVAARTFADLHPGAGALLVVADRELSGEDVLPALGTLDLTMGPAARAVLRSAAEPAAFAAPWAVAAALDRGARAAVLLGARQWVLGGLGDLIDAAGTHGLSVAGAVDRRLTPAEAARALAAPRIHPAPLACAATLGGRDALRWWKHALMGGAPPAGVLELLPGAVGAAVVHRPGLVVRAAAAAEAELTHSWAGYCCAGRVIGVADFTGADGYDAPSHGVGADLFWEYGRRLFADGRGPRDGAPGFGPAEGALARR